MGSKEDTDAVNKCATECGYPSDANIQLDSSSAAPVNPFVFIDSAAQVCLTLECVIKCSVAESNKICAGSGYLFRDVGFKQVQEASDKLQNDASNSSSATQQLIKQYLKTLPQQCIYIINPTNYDTTFPQHEGNDEINTVTPKTSKTEGNTEEEGVKQVTSRISHTDSDVVITRIFNEGFTTPSSEVSGDDNVMTKEIGKEGTIRIEVAETGDEYDIAMKSSPSSTSEEVVSTVAEGADSTSMKAKTSALESIPSHEEKEEEDEETMISSSRTSTSTDDRSRIMKNEEKGAASAANHELEKEKEEGENETVSDENDGGENNDETSHLQHPTTPVTIEEITERTIVVMNDDRDQEINTNTIMKHTAVGQQQQKLKHYENKMIKFSIWLNTVT
ncbi:unnamed protein product [Litomosoides sigmodontis]|uniref:Uncharacterized protein n=1 Tax=Litomosoides sigmodontis TaxID=42156 RepID=A0A3P6UBY7_LITSI|nr:unnamed protein product [Litomosoides sigmodontis]